MAERKIRIETETLSSKYCPVAKLMTSSGKYCETGCAFQAELIAAKKVEEGQPIETHQRFTVGSNRFEYTSRTPTATVMNAFKDCAVRARVLKENSP